MSAFGAVEPSGAMRAKRPGTCRLRPERLLPGARLACSAWGFVEPQVQERFAPALRAAAVASDLQRLARPRRRQALGRRLLLALAGDDLGLEESLDCAVERARLLEVRHVARLVDDDSRRSG
jgi:hypothetical protein